MTVFYLSSKHRIDRLIERARTCGLTADDIEALEALREVSELCRWILAHANEKLGKVKLCVEIANPGNRPVEELFLLTARSNSLESESK